MIIPPNPWVRSLVFYIELSGFSFFWMEKYAGKTVINGWRRVNIFKDKKQQ